jgi:hypothetical protein
MAGVLQPVTRGYDVALSIVRGFVSVALAAAVASTWADIKKPITAYYFGDFDPSGFDIERDLREKLEQYCPRSFEWVRLGVVEDDFAIFDLLPLKPKLQDRRSAAFLRAGYRDCAELDAIPADSIRHRLTDAIMQHIPADEWARLEEVERIERTQWQETMAAFRGAPS